MKLDRSRRIKLAQIVFGVAVVIGLVVAVKTDAASKPVHLATDWSHRHVIFSVPKSLSKRVQLLSNPRYVQQGLRRGSPSNGIPSRWRRAETQPLKGDWSMYLGYNGNPAAIVPGASGAGVYPAKFSFNSASANCLYPAPPPGQQPDFIVSNTGLIGQGTPVPAITTGTVTAVPSTGDTLIIFNNSGGATLTLTAAAANANTGTGTGTFDISGGTVASVATAIAASINIAGNGSFVGVEAFSAGAGLTIESTLSGSGGNNTYVEPTGTTYGTSISWNFEQFQDGGTGIPTIMAFDNIYKGTCNSGPLGQIPVPDDYWAYNTGGQSVTSPALSGDGTQVVFVQNVGTSAQLVVLKWANDGTSVNFPATLTSQLSAAAYRACTAPCMYSIPFSQPTAATDSMSSPFYDYSNDTVYVGDDGGYLHKFTGVFLGDPSEVISTVTNVWPAAVNAGVPLTSPVADDADGGETAGTPGVFVTDGQGYLYRVDATIGSGGGHASVIQTVKLADFGGFQDGPVLDPSTGNVYVFANQDPADSGSAFWQFPVDFPFNASTTSTPAGTEVLVSNDAATISPAFYDGTFDNIYFNSTGGTGNLYACSTHGGDTALWQIPITDGIPGAAVEGPTLATGNAGCSPVTEFFNTVTSIDYIYMSTPNLSATCGAAAAGAGCIWGYNVTVATGWGTGTGASAAAAEVGGTSAIIVDGAALSGGVAVPGASQVYFSTLGLGYCYGYWQGIGGCAIQASQTGLN